MSFSEASRVLWLSGARFMLRKRTAGLGSADRIRHLDVLLDTKIIRTIDFWPRMSLHRLVTAGGSCRGRRLTASVW